MVISLLVGFSNNLEDLNILDLNLVPVNLKLDSKGKYIRFHHSRVSGIEYRSIYLPNGTTVLQLRRLKLSAWQKAKCEAITIQIGSHSYMAGMEYRGDSMSRNGVLSHQMGNAQVAPLDGPILLTLYAAPAPQVRNILGFNKDTISNTDNIQKDTNLNRTKTFNEIMSGSILLTP